MSPQDNLRHGVMLTAKQIHYRIEACEKMLCQPQTRSGYSYLIARVKTLDEIVGAPERDLRALFPYVPMSSVQSLELHQDSTSGTQGGQSA